MKLNILRKAHPGLCWALNIIIGPYNRNGKDTEEDIEEKTV